MKAVMKLFEGKTKSERNKTIAAIVLGVLCLVVFYFAFGRGLFGSGTTATTGKPTPTPKTTSASKPGSGSPQMPSREEQTFVGETTPIVYNPDRFGAPGPGRNIFAFYEPPKPTPYVPPTPPPPKPIVTPTPEPPPIQIALLNPASVYAGANGFRLEIAGDRFTPDTKIYFEQQELPSTFVSEQRMTADIPGVLIRNAGKPQLMAQTADGTKRSNPVMLDVQTPPQPAFQYIGMIARKRSNNDTAYFKEPGKELPTSARLNDIVGGRFRVVSISNEKAILQDVNLEFNRVTLKLYEPPPTTGSSQPGGQPGRPGGFPGRETYIPFNPGGQPIQPANQRIPGIPDNIPRYQPPGNSNRAPANSKQDVDDDGDGS